MLPQTSQQEATISVSTVAEKVHLEKQLPFRPQEKEGPTVELYFHELTAQKHYSQKLLQAVAIILLGGLFLLTLPVIAGIIKLFSSEAVFRRTKVPGKRGIPFELITYPTDTTARNKDFFWGKFLRRSGLEKLPSIINIWNGDIALIGPQPYPSSWCNRWNEELSDFYKRFAVKPGFFGISELVTDPEDIERVSKSLNREFQYILRPSLKKDFRRLFGIV